MLEGTDMDDNHWQLQQQQDEENQQQHALKVLERIRERCGSEIAEEAAYQMGMGTVWKRMSEKEAA